MTRRVVAPALALAVLAWSAAPGAAAGAETLTFGVVSASPPYWALFAGRDKGFYERHGIVLDLFLTGTSVAATQALIGGSLEMTVSATDAAFIAQQKTPEIRQIFSLVGRLPTA